MIAVLRLPTMFPPSYVAARPCSLPRTFAQYFRSVAHCVCIDMTSLFSFSDKAKRSN